MTDQPFIRPDVQAYLEQLKAMPHPEFTAEFLAMIRTLPPELMAAADLPVGDIAVDRDFEMPGPAGPIKLRLFDPRDHRAAGPAVVFYHGGGFCVGSIGSHAGLSAEMARQLDLPVISVEYRLAPENPWPAAPDDAEAAARWIAANGAALEREIDGLILSGDSAGGNLALVTALALRDNAANVPVLQHILIYPGVDTQGDYSSRKAYSDGYGLDGAAMKCFEEHYQGDPASWRHSPLKADLAGLPPTILATAALDPLCDQGAALEENLKVSGCKVEHLEFQGTIHGFATYRKAIPSARDDLKQILDASKAMLNVNA